MEDPTSRTRTIAKIAETRRPDQSSTDIVKVPLIDRCPAGTWVCIGELSDCVTHYLYLSSNRFKGRLKTGGLEYNHEYASSL
jgi:hypothetical protein